MSYTVKTLPPCSVVSHERIDDALIDVFPKTGGFAAMLCGVLRVGVAVAVLVPENRDGPRQASQAIRIVEKNLEEFFGDPATHGYLRVGTPVIAVFKELCDYTRLLSIIPELPLSLYEQYRRDEAFDDAAAEARGECEECEEYDPDGDLDEVVVTPGTMR